jgi:hypothetical protein
LFDKEVFSLWLWMFSVYQIFRGLVFGLCFVFGLWFGFCLVEVVVVQRIFDVGCGWLTAGCGW